MMEEQTEQISIAEIDAKYLNHLEKGLEESVTRHKQLVNEYNASILQVEQSRYALEFFQNYLTEKYQTTKKTS